VQRVTSLYNHRVQHLEQQLDEETAKRRQAEEDLRILKGLISITINTKKETTPRPIDDRINLEAYVANHSIHIQKSFPT
jgi:hypothetical protein